MKIRTIPENVKSTAPVTAMYNAIKSMHVRREEDRQTAARMEKGAGKTMEQMALAVFAFRKHLPALPEGARHSFQALENALSDGGVEIIDYTGAAVDEDMSSKVRIEGWADGSESCEVVQETFTPEIRWNGGLLHTAQVFCLRAANDVQKAAAPVSAKDASADVPDASASSTNTPVADGSPEPDASEKSEAEKEKDLPQLACENSVPPADEKKAVPSSWFERLKAWFLGGPGVATLEKKGESKNNSQDDLSAPGKKQDENTGMQ